VRIHHPAQNPRVTTKNCVVVPIKQSTAGCYKPNLRSKTFSLALIEIFTQDFIDILPLVSLDASQEQGLVGTELVKYTP